MNTLKTSEHLKLEPYRIFIQLDLDEKSITPLQRDFIVRTEKCVYNILSRQLHLHVACDSFKSVPWSVLYYGSSLGARWAAKSLTLDGSRIGYSCYSLCTLLAWAVPDTRLVSPNRNFRPITSLSERDWCLF